ncbi:MAG: helix-turn-helix domain-containing protein [Myxococcota bacterium]
MAEEIQRSCVATRVRRLNRQITRTYDELLRPLEMSGAQLTLLVGIALHPGVKAVQLGKALDLERSTLSRNLARMVERGWVREKAAGAAVELHPTSAGLDALRCAYPAWLEAQKRAALKAAQLEPLLQRKA